MVSYRKTLVAAATVATVVAGGAPAYASPAAKAKPVRLYVKLVAPKTVARGKLFSVSEKVTLPKNDKLASWTLSFGDGKSAKNKAGKKFPKHSYAKPGHYLVTLHIFDSHHRHVTSKAYVTVPAPSLGGGAAVVTTSPAAAPVTQAPVPVVTATPAPQALSGHVHEGSSALGGIPVEIFDMTGTQPLAEVSTQADGTWTAPADLPTPAGPAGYKVEVNVSAAAPASVDATLDQMEIDQLAAGSTSDANLQPLVDVSGTVTLSAEHHAPADFASLFATVSAAPGVAYPLEQDTATNVNGIYHLMLATGSTWTVNGVDDDGDAFGQTTIAVTGTAPITHQDFVLQGS